MKYVIILIVGVAIIGLTHSRLGKVYQGEAKRYLIAPPPLLKNFHFGFNEPIADSLWLRSMQDLDFCEEKKNERDCKGNGWVTKMFLALFDLSPHFSLPAKVGPVSVSVIVSDIEGASLLFDRSVENFPNDWQVLYMAAYHFLVEVKNKEKAAPLLRRAARNGGPDWLYVLSTRLFVDTGQKEMAISIYETLKKTEGYSEGMLKRMREKLGISEDSN